MLFSVGFQPLRANDGEGGDAIKHCTGKHTMDAYYYHKFAHQKPLERPLGACCSLGAAGGLLPLRAAATADGVPLRQRSVAALGLLLVAGPGVMREEPCMGQWTSVPQLLSTTTSIGH